MDSAAHLTHLRDELYLAASFQGEKLLVKLWKIAEDHSTSSPNAEVLVEKSLFLDDFNFESRLKWVERLESIKSLVILGDKKIGLVDVKGQYSEGIYQQITVCHEV